MLAKLKNYLFTGILVTAPVVITFWIVISLVRIFDRLITPLLPLYLNPNTYLPRDVPGLGLIVLVVFLVIIGFIAANFFGSYILKKTDFVLNKIPLVKVFYNTYCIFYIFTIKWNSHEIYRLVYFQAFIILNTSHLQVIFNSKLSLCNTLQVICISLNLQSFRD